MTTVFMGLKMSFKVHAFENDIVIFSIKTTKTRFYDNVQSIGVRFFVLG